jgi:predicted flap endonuclease-1-like 5' DNA nuclease
MSTNSMAIPPAVLPDMSKGERARKIDRTNPLSNHEKMTEPMDELKQTSEKPLEDRDDLQQIKGIGRSTARVLNSLGIYRYADLVDHTPESLADLLKPKLPSISSQRIERADWLGQARTLNRQQEREETTMQAVDQAASATEGGENQTTQAPTEPGEPPVALTEAEEIKQPGKDREGWQELADFFVSFGYSDGPEGEKQLQTKIHYSQTEQSAQWPGVVTDQLIKWMINQANLPVPEEPSEQVEVEPPAEPLQPVVEEEIYLELSDLWVSEVKVPVLAGMGQQSLLRADARLNLSGSAAFKLAEQAIPFTVELFLADSETFDESDSDLVGTYSGRLAPGTLIYEVQQDFPIPAMIGRYQLYLVANLLPPGTAVTHLQGPIVRVEA